MKRLFLLLLLLPVLAFGQVFDSRIPITCDGGKVYYMPFQLSRSSGFSEVTTAVFALHGDGNNIAQWQRTYADAQDESVLDSTLVFGIQFLEADTTTGTQTPNTIDMYDLYNGGLADVATLLWWDNGGAPYRWLTDSDTYTSEGTDHFLYREDTISARECLTQTFEYIMDLCPNLQHITLSGWRGGANMLYHYQCALDVSDSLFAAVDDVRHVYFDPRTVTPLPFDTRPEDPDWPFGGWLSPAEGLDTTDCVNYDYWPYGLSDAATVIGYSRTAVQDWLADDYVTFFYGTGSTGPLSQPCGSEFLGGDPYGTLPRDDGDGLTRCRTMLYQWAEEDTKPANYFITQLGGYTGGSGDIADMMDEPEARFAMFYNWGTDDQVYTVTATTPLDTVSTLAGWADVLGINSTYPQALFAARVDSFEFLARTAAFHQDFTATGDPTYRSGVSDGDWWSQDFDGTEDCYYYAHPTNVTDDSLAWSVGKLVSILFRSQDTSGGSTYLFAADQADNYVQLNSNDGELVVRIEDGTNSDAFVVGAGWDDSDLHLLTVYFGADTVAALVDGVD